MRRATGIRHLIPGRRCRAAPPGFPRSRRGQGIGALGVVALLALAVLLGWVIYAGVADGDLGADATPSLAEVAADPDRFEGRQLVVSGPVRRTLGDHAVMIGAEHLLVLARALPDELGPGDVVQVVGAATRVDGEEAERRLGVSLDARFDGNLAGRPGVIAERITIERAPMPTALEVTAARLAAEPGLAGSLVVLRGTVTRRLSPSALIIEDSVVVVAPVTATRRASPGRKVMVSGRAGRFEPERLGRELGLRLDGAVHRPWVGRPAISATSVILRR